MNPVHRIEIRVPEDVVDANGHVNNVVYVQWMQDAAIAHSRASGCSDLSRSLGATWVARTHHIEYLRPAFAGDVVVVLTWVSDFRKVRSLRKYRFVRAEDSALLAQAETDWVFVDARSGRPRAVPGTIRDLFQLVGKDQERDLIPAR
jgi:acyl-CoA thioester hydrolase